MPHISPPDDDVPVKPYPTCGRDIDGYKDCPDCLRIELLVSEFAANERQLIRDILEAS